MTQREDDLLELEANEIFNEQWNEFVKGYLGDRFPEVNNASTGQGKPGNVEPEDNDEENDGDGS